MLTRSLLVFAWIISIIAAAIGALMAFVGLLASSGTPAGTQGAFFASGGAYLLLLVPPAFIVFPYLAQRALRTGLIQRALVFTMLAILLGLCPVLFLVIRAFS